MLGFVSGDVLVALNTTGAAVAVPAGEVLLSSVPAEPGTLPADAAAWVRLA